jgi:Fe-S cluster biogenesis protein NfuA
MGRRSHTGISGEGMIIKNDINGGKQQMEEKVKKVLGRVSPFLKADGGGVELVSVEDGAVKVKLTGACCGCAMSTMTMSNFIEKVLKEEIPEVKSVEAV